MARSLFFLFTLAGVGALAFYAGQYWAPSSETGSSDPIVVEKASPSVIQAMRSLSRLEGAVFHMERVIDLREKQSRFRGLVEAEDALLLVASGETIAGVDLAQVIEADVEESNDGRRVHVRLPAPEVFSASLDSSRTYVHSRKTDVLAERDETLEAKARARAQETLRQAAIEAGILRVAEESVRRSLMALLLSLGFEQVEISFRASPAGHSRP